MRGRWKDNCRLCQCDRRTTPNVRGIVTSLAMAEERLIAMAVKGTLPVEDLQVCVGQGANTVRGRHAWEVGLDWVDSPSRWTGPRQGGPYPRNAPEEPGTPIPGKSICGPVDASVEGVLGDPSPTRNRQTDRQVGDQVTSPCLRCGHQGEPPHGEPTCQPNMLARSP